MINSYITNEYQIIKGYGFPYRDVKVNSSLDKFCVIEIPSIAEIRELIDCVYDNFKWDLIKAIEEEPDVWLMGVKRGSILNLSYFNVTSLRPYLGGLSTITKLSEFMADVANRTTVISSLRDVSAKVLIHSIRGGRGYHQGTRPNVYEHLEASQDGLDFFTRFIGEILREPKSRWDKYGSPYSYKLLEPMMLRSWILHPANFVLKTANAFLYFPNKRPDARRVKMKYMQNKVFAPFPAERESIWKELALDNVILRGESEYAISFLQHLVYSSNMIGIEDISKELCFVISDATGISKVYGTAIEKVLIEIMHKNSSLFGNDKFDNFYITREKAVYKSAMRDRPTLTDGTFRWVLAIDSTLDQWQALFAEYAPISSLRSTASVAFALNPFLQWLLVLTVDARTVLINPDNVRRYIHIFRNEAMSKSAVAPVLYDYLESNVTERGKNKCLTELEKFFLWYQKYKNPYFEIPITASDRSFEYQAPKKSVHDAIPTRILHLMKAVLVGNDYEWPKTIGRDWTGQVVGVGEWSPVRAVFMQTLLTLPLRFDNAQSADSGFKDEFIFDDHTGDFVLNPNGIKGRAAGIFRKITVGLESITGFYFTRNKTTRDGLRVTWDNPELRTAMFRVLKFLDRQNGNFTHSFIKSKHLTKKGQRDQLYVEVYPLFPDLAKPEVRERRNPLTEARYRLYFLDLLAETERRFNATEEGSKEPIKLITKWTVGSDVLHPVSACWTPYSLRVTGITNFALAGLPPQMIAECLSGHSSILMNLYYTKYGPSLVSQLISDKAREISLNVELFPISAWRDDLNLLDRVLDAHIPAVAFGGLQATNTALYQISRGFICPNGGALCGEGNLHRPKASNKAGMVEGGTGNCPLCRFAITGPMLLNQQVIAANADMYIIAQEAEKQNLLDRDARAANEAGDWKTARMLETQRDNLGQRISALFETWIARTNFIRKSIDKMPSWELARNLAANNSSCEEIVSSLNSSSSDGTFVTQGEISDIRYSFEKTSSSEEMTWCIAAAGQVSTVDSVPGADLRFVALMNRVLHKNGMDPFLIDLSEENSKRAAVLLGRFMTDYFEHEAKSKGIVADGAGRGDFAKLLRGESTINPDGTLKRAIEHITARLRDAGTTVPKYLSELTPVDSSFGTKVRNRDDDI